MFCFIFEMLNIDTGCIHRNNKHQGIMAAHMFVFALGLP